MGKARTAPCFFVLDPIDGTSNLMHGMKHSAISLSMHEAGRYALAIVYDPYLEEMFVANRKGAFLNGVPIHVSSRPLADALIGFGTNPYDRTRSHDKMCIRDSNNIEVGGWDRIFPGQELVIEYADAPQGEMAVNGYAYPFIEPATLHQALPYLTYLTPFSYSAQPDGELDDIEDERLIALAKQWGVVPILHVSNLDEDERFSTDLANQLLNDPVAVRRLIEEILETLVEEGYGLSLIHIRCV